MCGVCVCVWCVCVCVVCVCVCGVCVCVCVVCVCVWCGVVCVGGWGGLLLQYYIIMFRFRQYNYYDAMHVVDKLLLSVTISPPHTHTTLPTHPHTQDELHQARLVELDTVTGERDKCRGEFEDLRKQRLDQFMSGFSIITNKLKEMYQVRGGGKLEGLQ